MSVWRKKQEVEWKGSERPRGHWLSCLHCLVEWVPARYEREPDGSCACDGLPPPPSHLHTTSSVAGSANPIPIPPPPPPFSTLPPLAHRIDLPLTSLCECIGHWYKTRLPSPASHRQPSVSPPSNYLQLSLPLVFLSSSFSKQLYKRQRSTIQHDFYLNHLSSPSLPLVDFHSPVLISLQSPIPDFLRVSRPNPDSGSFLVSPTLWRMLLGINDILNSKTIVALVISTQPSFEMRRSETCTHQEGR